MTGQRRVDHLSDSPDSDNTAPVIFRRSFSLFLFLSLPASGLIPANKKEKKEKKGKTVRSEQARSTIASRIPLSIRKNTMQSAST